MSEGPQEFKFGQWTLRVDPEKPDGYEMLNLGPNGERRYYRMIPGKYGEPLIDQEPDLAIPVPAGLDYRLLNGGTKMVPTPEDKITGVICYKGPRFSLTNAKAKAKGVSISVNPDGSIQVGDRAWALTLLLCPDGQRFTPNRWVALLVPGGLSIIWVAEMADLLTHWWGTYTSDDETEDGA